MLRNEINAQLKPHLAAKSLTAERVYPRMRRSIKNTVANLWLFLLLIGGGTNSLFADKVQDEIDRLRSDDWHGRIFAAKALGELRDERAVEPLIEMFKEEFWKSDGPPPMPWRNSERLPSNR